MTPRLLPTSLQFFGQLKWIDGFPLLRRLTASPLPSVIEPYRARLFAEALDRREQDGRPTYNLVLSGRAKKNWKSADLILAALYRLLAWSSPGGNQCYLLANDLGQAGDDLDLASKIIRANPILKSAVRIKANEIVRKDGAGFLLILPAGDVAGAHGKTYCFCGFDEIHAYRDWDLLEAMQLDPTRPDALQWITSYASIHHRPGVPLYDLLARGKAGSDPRMCFSWYGGDFSTDPEAHALDPESRANPSRGSWADQGYLAQQRARLPSHKYRRLHLNLPGTPEGSAFQPEPVMESIARGVTWRAPEHVIDRSYRAFVDMSGGSTDDAVLAIGWTDPAGQAVVCCLRNQGPPPPFDPAQAVTRFVAVLKQYRIFEVTGDAYAGLTFAQAFQSAGIAYRLAPLPAHKLYEALEPLLNAGRVDLLDHAECEQQLLGLVWKGGKITHPGGEHDDYANAVAGLAFLLLGGVIRGDMPVLSGRPLAAAIDAGNVPLHLTPSTPVMTPSDWRILERQQEVLTSPGADRNRGGLII